MTIEFTRRGWEDLEYWLDNDPKISLKIRTLLKVIARTPFAGEGKPEALKHDLKGFWSRRLSLEHRMVYHISGKTGDNHKCVVLQCRFHYD
ncbi:MAG: Txe/YoeB family addiction module toxin [Chitinophagaceae bacterium]|nr:MAG: Txe/YoeB family addiction module toxin [Chitinophagaceae bacterium]